MNRLILALAVVALTLVSSVDGSESGKAPAAPQLFHDLNPREYKLGDWGKVTTVSDGQCVVASELIGHWVTNIDLTKRLMHEKDIPPYEVIFAKNADSEKRVIAAVEKHMEFLDKNKGKEVGDWLRRDAQTAFLAGTCELRVEEMLAKSDFLLIASAATPHLILLTDGQLQSCNVMLARDASGDSDLLFMGDDNNAGSFRAFERKTSRERK